MKKVLIALVLLSGAAYAQPGELNATTALVIDADTNAVLFQKNDEQVRSIASITKMMTALVTVEKQLPLEEQLTITHEDDLATRLRGGATGGSLAIGAVLTRGELLHLALMNSQNRAAAALGRTYPGGMDAFVAAMNTKAKELRMINTTFVDPTGLMNANKSTASDLVLLVKAASEHQVIRDFSTSTSFQMTTYYKDRHRKIGFGTTNRLVSANKWNVLVQKTGYIRDAGHCVVMMTTVASRKVIIVLLNTPNNQLRARDAISLMYWVEHNTVPTNTELQTLSPYSQAKSHKQARRKRR